MSSTQETSRRLADFPVPQLRKALITVAFLIIILGVFYAMVHDLLVAAILGAIAGAYLRPVQNWVSERVNLPAASAILTIVVLVVPVLALCIYGYLGVHDAATYLANHQQQVASEINRALTLLPFVDQMQATEEIVAVLQKVSSLVLDLPAGFYTEASEFAVDAAVFFFTAFYVLTEADVIVSYLRGKVPPRYQQFAQRLEEHVQGVLYGAIYSSVLTQLIKSLVLMVLLLVFDVPLAIVLALLSFVISFFPVVGSWTIYVPAAIYLLVFQDAAWQAATLLLVSFIVNTIFLSMIVRPKLAADQARVLNFYWMFLGLVAGVYTFGIAGLVLGPMVVGILKAIIDTLTSELEWQESHDGKEAEVFNGN